jgi:phosphoglycolate phosphatase-like HAD superfamily hydrolase
MEPEKRKGSNSFLDSLTGIQKEEVIYVGDAPSDIIACRKVGIPVVAAAWAETAEPQKLEELGPDEMFYTIRDFSVWLFDNI